MWADGGGKVAVLENWNEDGIGMPRIAGTVEEENRCLSVLRKVSFALTLAICSNDQRAH